MATRQHIRGASPSTTVTRFPHAEGVDVTTVSHSRPQAPVYYPIHRMKQVAIWGMIAALALVGCKKKETAAAEAVSPAPQPDAAAQASPPPEGAAPAEQSVQIVTTAKPKPVPPPPAYLTVRAE